MNILTLCGSLRADSSNAALLKALRSLVTTPVDWTDFAVQELPFFDPGLQFGPGVPPVVQTLRERAGAADFLIIATPEYAHGIPGVLKNALEWLVCEETLRKKVLLFVVAPGGGRHVREALLETLGTMDLIARPEMSLTLQTGRRNLAPDGRILNESLRTELENFMKKHLQGEER